MYYYYLLYICVYLLNPFQNSKESYYFDTLKLMSMWDGSEKTLYASLIDQPQYELYQKYGYKNLSDLFEQWINDLIWFQHAELSEIDAIEQEQRVKQYPTISDDEEYQYVPLYQETMRIPKGMSLNLFGKITESLKRSNTQIQENSTSGSGLAFCL